MKVLDAVQWASMQLAGASATPRLDSELMLGHVLARDRAWLRAHDDSALEAAQSDEFMALVARRASGEPIAYLLGSQEFWSLPLLVSPHTLIPRPDTELLVETVLRVVPDRCCDVLDLGTGTGAIALALKHERPSWQVWAVDRIPEAVSLAEQNAQRLGLRLECRVSNWFDAIQGKRFQVIVSNPPYIDEGDAHLSGDGVKFEPLSALVAGREGLADLQQIVRDSPIHLVSGGVLAVEHGWEQEGAVTELFLQAGFEAVETLKDLAGQSRVTMGYWKP